MHQKITNKGSMYVPAEQVHPSKKPVVQSGGDLRGRTGNQ